MKQELEDLTKMEAFKLLEDHTYEELAAKFKTQKHNVFNKITELFRSHDDYKVKASLTVSVTEKHTLLAMGYRFMYKLNKGNKYWIGFVERDKNRLLPCFDEKDQNYRFDVLSEANDYLPGGSELDKNELLKLI